MEYFLITSADERTWKFDRPVIFLGEWCREWNRRDVWNQMDAKLATPYTADSKQREVDDQYTYKLYEELLIESTEALNLLHGTSHSIRYWRILLGPWMSTFINILFHRWSCLQLALQEYKISGTVALCLTSDTIVPFSFEDFPEIYLSHAWNQHIFSRILSNWSSVPMEWISSEDLSSPQGRQVVAGDTMPLVRHIKRRIASGASRFSKYICRSTDAFFISTYLPIKQDFLLQLALGQIPALWRSIVAPKVGFNIQKRQQLHLNPRNYTGFEQCVRVLLLEQIPTVFVEGYSELQSIVSQLPWPRHPRVIFTSNNYWGDDVFKAWAAQQAQEGVPYVVGQHGGYAGVTKYINFAEGIDGAAADRYLTWGWTETGNTKTYPGPALKLIGLPTSSWSPTGHLLQVTAVLLRYTRYPWDFSEENADYLEEQLRFAEALPRAIRDRLIVRLHCAHNVDGEPQDIRWRDRHPDIRLDLGTGPIEPLIRQSRLYIATYNGTTFLETLGRNIPTIMFWNPKHNELRLSAQPYFDRIKGVGIFHGTPESAAAKVAEVWDDVPRWWGRSDVQEARRYFCDRFARVPKNPIRVLKEALSAAGAGNVSEIGGVRATETACISLVKDEGKRIQLQDKTSDHHRVV